MASAPCWFAGTAAAQPPAAKAKETRAVAISTDEEPEEEDEDTPEYLPGLVAEYTNQAGKRAVRLDARVNFRWTDGRPDARLTPSSFSAVWQGQLLTVTPGSYRLHVHAVGKVELEINHQRLPLTAQDNSIWSTTAPLDLEYGHHPISIRYQSPPAPEHSTARINLFWSGPQFQLEPLTERWLFHEPDQRSLNEFARGEQLVRVLRCAACHDLPGQRQAAAAPDLTQLAGNLSRAWLEQWLQSSPQAHASDTTSSAAPRRMPHFGLSSDDAAALSDWLLSPAAAAPEASNEAEVRPDKSSIARGEQLLSTIGCLACHTVGDLGTAGLHGGGDLSAIADKRPANFFARWLADPASLNAAHRMPAFPLSLQEQHDLSAYLGTLHAKDQPADVHERNKTNATASFARGQQLATRHHCGACHQLPGQEVNAPMPQRTALKPANFTQAGCWSAPGPQHPGFALPESDRRAIQSYLTRFVPLADTIAEPTLASGQDLFETQNCLACHSRGLNEGMQATAQSVVAVHQELAAALPTLSPPALDGVGDKLSDTALADAITLKHPPLRPWLKVRMPRFRLSEADMNQLVNHLVEQDRIPPGAPFVQQPIVADKPATAAAWSAAGSRLVTADGFGCTSCHQIGNSLPKGVSLAAQGTNLSRLDSRIRREWYERWVRNPARIVPRMEMPSVVSPIHGVLHDDLSQQLAAVWHVLNQPDFTPPEPNPVRVVRARNLPDQLERAIVMTDVLEIGKHAHLRGVLVGLGNRHNVLFDLETNRLASWWQGDTARQRTRGKSWYWEPGGTPLFHDTSAHGELLLRRDDQWLIPILHQQTRAQLDALEHTDRGMTIEYRHYFSSTAETATDSPAESSMRVTQSLEPWTSTGVAPRNGFQRTLVLHDLPEGSLAHLDIAAANAAVSNDPTTLQIANQDQKWTIQTATPQTSFSNQKLPARGDRMLIEFPPASADGTARITLQYSSMLPADRFPQLPPDAASLPAALLHVAPGFEVTRLPLPGDQMPTGLAWRPDGTLVFTSLKGQVFLARDSNGDETEDELQPFGDELAAPYGVAVPVDAQATHAIDVINKYGLLRLHDPDNDGRVDRTEVMASGWGYTTDYHDWAVGLPRDLQGNYYVTIPGQVDQRRPEQALLRGTALKLSPQSPSSQQPRRFHLETLAAGLRFPMGIALHPSGAVFVSDNQGQYTPFNELNHVHDGLHYGFINKVDERAGFNPPFEPAAVNLPHPWTRSVNGICFLTTPAAQLAEHGSSFGPWEGQLVGCEYDTRQLVRMSLEKVGDTFQGAAYPLTVVPPDGLEPLEGPLVCQVSPQGDLYVGNIRDSAWGAGRNTGSIVRFRPSGDWPAGIAEVSATPTGFTIRFAQPVPAAAASNPENYHIDSYRRIPTPAYGGPDVDRAASSIRRLDLSPDRRSVTLELEELRAGFLYELRVKGLARPGQPFHPAEAHYTLRNIPRP